MGRSAFTFHDDRDIAGQITGRHAPRARPQQPLPWVAAGFVSLLLASRLLFARGWRLIYGLNLARGTPSADMKASMARDLERGNRLELDWLSGKVVELGRALGVPTPANEAVYAALKLRRMGGG